MTALDHFSLLIQVFGVFAFGSLLGLYLRPPKNGGSTSPAPSRVTLAILVTSFLWFVTGALDGLLPELDGALVWGLQTVRLFLVCLFPPLIMHIVYCECASHPSLHRPLWRLAPRVTYGLGLLLCLTLVVGFYRLVPLDRGFVRTLSSVGIGALFTLTAVYSVAALSVARERTESRTERAHRRTMVGMFVFLLVFVGLLSVAGGMINVAGFTGASIQRLLDLTGSSMPLLFIFFGTYHEDRFRFFDLFVKRGLALVATVVPLVLLFGLVFPRLEGLDLRGSRPWIYAVLLLPAAMALPRLFSALGRVLDRRWLGRRFTTVEAVKHFLATLQDATTEPRLAELAAAGLTEIFQAPARVHLALQSAPEDAFERKLEIPIEGPDGQLGSILMGRRTNELPYFSEDRALLRSLADVLSYLVENVRLQARRQEQERISRELSLQASRSELKALRAQINPHFLFNALNAIAGLIHKDPLRADRAVEQLAEVFRFTLRRSDAEWSPVEEELAFARAYLEVEQARFGRRLAFTFDDDPGVRGLRIPAMLLQTLVENAVKHGVAVSRDPGRIEIAVRREGDRLAITVADTGPGFAEPERMALAREGSSGYGLTHVRRRLAGHFADRAALTVERDAARGLTVVGLSLPLAELPSGTESHGDGSRPAAAR